MFGSLVSQSGKIPLRTSLASYLDQGIVKNVLGFQSTLYDATDDPIIPYEYIKE